MLGESGFEELDANKNNKQENIITKIIIYKIIDINRFILCV
tara:strand:- start:3651 stop:3773 length:123 start_codon:yes stop_codon:yes gene_type:complete